MIIKEPPNTERSSILKLLRCIAMSVIILSCEDMDKLPLCLSEIWKEVEALYLPLQNAIREVSYTCLR